MKRLLLAPQLIALAGCSSDIVIKNDFGEKYIVKEKAVKASGFAQTIKTAKWVLSGKSSRNMADKYKTGEIKPLSTRTTEEMVELYEYEAMKAEIIYDDFKPTLEKHDDDTALILEIIYTPIFEDLNGNKSVLSEKSILCTNPKLKKVAEATSDEILDDLNLNNLDRKVCDKYAKF